MGVASRRFQRVEEALLSGRPRRARALARVYSRTAAPDDRLWAALYEASALLWEGEHGRAARFASELARRPDAEVLGVLPVVVQLEALIFDQRVDEARALYFAHAPALRASTVARGDIASIYAMLRFEDGALDEARAELERALVLSAPRDPIRCAAHFVLAAIAHRRGDADAMRKHLETAADTREELFIVRWAKSQLSELVPAAPAARRDGPVARSFRRALGAIEVGLGTTFFRRAPLERHAFSMDQVFGLLLFDVMLVMALRAVEYERGATPYWVGLLALVVPLAGVGVSARVAAGGARQAGLRIAGAFYGAFPVFAVVAYAVARLERAGMTVRSLGAVELALTSATAVATFLVVLWASAVFLFVTRVVRRAGVMRLLGALIAFGASFAVPFYAVNDEIVFFPPVSDHRDWEADEKRREALLFAHADELRDAESALRVERPGVTDLYFVGAAGWARQDVFGRDVRDARHVLDSRFDTAGRSIILVNDPYGAERSPLAAAVSLRHALRTVGRSMNRDEDVLFLYLTSHGSAEGLSLTFPPESGFRNDTLTPAELRSMLDFAGIRWRILVIAGCESGVFITPLASEWTVVATAAAADRASYGCGMGNEHTEFGRALFADHLRRDPTIVGALRGAIADINEQERRDARTPSRPQLSVGAAIEKKLAELEHTLVDNSSEPR